MPIDRVIDGRIDYYRGGLPSAESRPEVRLEGLKLRGIDKDLRINQRVRAWALLDGQYPVQDDPDVDRDPLNFNLRIKARIYDGPEPELLLVDEEMPRQHLIVPESAMVRGRFGIFEFGKPSPITPDKLRFGQVIEGVGPKGERAAFVVGTSVPGSEMPSLETFSEPPVKLQLEVENDGKLLKAGGYRVLSHTLSDWRTWIQDARERGLYPSDTGKMNPQTS